MNTIETKPAFVVELQIMFPAFAPAEDLKMAEWLVNEIKDLHDDLFVVMEGIRWSK